MVNMDLKGLTWVGHVYQKFEAMCLEVEEVMYQDTVKYVENQVQTVGANVKKFYSGVMQDFLPPSSMDLVKEAAASNSPAEEDTDVGIYKRPKIGIKEEALKVDSEQLSDDSKAPVDLDKDAGHGAFFHGFDIEDTLFQPSSGNNVKAACSGLSSKQRDNKTTNKSSLGVKKISEEENLSLSEMFGGLSHTVKDLSRASPFYGPSDENQKALCDQIDTSPISVKVEANECNCKEETCDECENATEDTPGVSTDSQSCSEIENARLYSSFNGKSAELNAADICRNNGVVSLAGSPFNRDVQHTEFLDKFILLCHPGRADDLTGNTIESNIGVDQETETIQQNDDIKVEKSCVLVNGDELHFVSSKENKRWPYKKKIRDAISSRMRSGRKQEYEQLAVLYVEDVNSSQESSESLKPTILKEDMKRSPSGNLCELEWELL